MPSGKGRALVFARNQFSYGMTVEVSAERPKNIAEIVRKIAKKTMSLVCNAAYNLLSQNNKVIEQAK